MLVLAACFLCRGAVKHITGYTGFELRSHKEALYPAPSELKLYKFSAIFCGKQARGRFQPSDRNPRAWLTMCYKEHRTPPRIGEIRLYDA